MLILCVMLVFADTTRGITDTTRGITDTTRGITEEQYSRFPRLFHLDDYEECLARADGVYCLGTFHIAPAKLPHRTYQHMKEYSKDPYNFNRTLLHRGYCVSARCPALAAERNTSLRFEQCAAQWAQPRSLRLSLHKHQYCRSHAQDFAQKQNPEPIEISDRIFVYVVAALVVFSALGTTYDVLTGDDGKKNRLLVVWSLRSNWRRLTATYEDGDPRLIALLPVQGIRVLLMTLILTTHTGCIQVMSYNYNPRFIEEISREPWLMIFLNGTSVVQVFIVVSSFLLAYNLLLHSKTQPLSLWMLPWCIAKRVVRIAPVHLLVVWFAATWWPRSSSGPMWPALVETEAAVCRRKWWTHALFINNLVDPDDQCLVQTWFLAVDMQLYVVASALTLILWRQRMRALPILATLIIASCLLNAGLSYTFDWKALMYFVYPENVSKMYHGIPSFSWLYMSPWGSLPACLIGLFLAHLHFELQERGFKASSHTWLWTPYHLSIPLIVSWLTAGGAVRDSSTPLRAAAYVALERPVLSLLAAFTLFAMFNGVDGYPKRVFGWRGWHAMGRLSLAVLMVHWCINMTIAASRLQPATTTFLDVMLVWHSTVLISYLAAIPITLIVEMPLQRFLSALIF